MRGMAKNRYLSYRTRRNMAQLPRAGANCELLPRLLPEAQTQQRPPRGDLTNYPYLHRKTGAGEAIRTPDPNLGKVVLYP